MILEIAPGAIQNGMFNTHSLLAPLFPTVGKLTPSRQCNRPVRLALAEALSWLVNEGLLGPLIEISTHFSLRANENYLRSG